MSSICVCNFGKNYCNILLGTKLKLMHYSIGWKGRWLSAAITNNAWLEDASDFNFDLALLCSLLYISERS